MIIQLQRKRCGRTFIEPCAGTGQLTKHLAEAGLIPLRSYDISQGYDARVIEYPHDAEFFITNPPWTRQLLHPIIVHLKRQKTTWLLFDADWAYDTSRAVSFVLSQDRFCRAGEMD